MLNLDPIKQRLEKDYFITKAKQDITALIAEVERLREGLNGREPLRWFVEQMEQTLKANDHKGGWETLNPSWLLMRLREETDELHGAMSPSCGCREANCPHVLQDPWHRANMNQVIKEATDVANFAMMIADKARRSLKGVNNE